MSVTFASASVTELSVECLLAAVSALEADPCDDKAVCRRCEVISQVLPGVAGQTPLLSRLSQALLLFPALRWHSLRAIGDPRVWEPCIEGADAACTAGLFSCFLSVSFLEAVNAALDACLLLKDASTGISLPELAKQRFEKSLQALDPECRAARRATAYIPEFNQLEVDIIDDFLSWTECLLFPGETSKTPGRSSFLDSTQGPTLGVKASVSLFLLLQSTCVPEHFEWCTKMLSPLAPLLTPGTPDLSYPVLAEIRRLIHVL